MCFSCTPIVSAVFDLSHFVAILGSFLRKEGLEIVDDLRNGVLVGAFSALAFRVVHPRCVLLGLSADFSFS